MGSREKTLARCGGEFDWLEDDLPPETFQKWCIVVLVLVRFLILGWLIYETLDPDAWSISKYRKFSKLRRTQAICAEMHHGESHFRPFQGQLQQWRSELQGKRPPQWLSQTMSSTPSTKRSLLSSLWVCPRPRIKGIEDGVLVDAPSAALQTCKVHGTYIVMSFIDIYRGDVPFLNHLGPSTSNNSALIIQLHSFLGDPWSES